MVYVPEGSGREAAETLDGRVERSTPKPLRPMRLAPMADSFQSFVSSYGLLNIERMGVLHRDMSVLDLGCGSMRSETLCPERASDSRTFAPSLCRYLHSHGVYVVGVDKAYPTYDVEGTGQTEGWEFHQMDLSVGGALDLFPGNSFDLVNAGQLIGHGNGNATSPTLLPRGEESYDEYYQWVEAEMFRQALRIVRPGGLFVVNRKHIYQKDTGPLRFRFSDMSRPEHQNVRFPLELFEVTDWAYLRGDPEMCVQSDA